VSNGNYVDDSSALEVDCDSLSFNGVRADGDEKKGQEEKVGSQVKTLGSGRSGWPLRLAG